MYLHQFVLVASHLAHCRGYLHHYGYEIDQEVEWSFEITTYGSVDNSVQDFSQYPKSQYENVEMISSPKPVADEKQILEEKTEKGLETAIQGSHSIENGNKIDVEDPGRSTSSNRSSSEQMDRRNMATSVKTSASPAESRKPSVRKDSVSLAICPICLDPYRYIFSREKLSSAGHDVVSIFKCGHLMHFKCISGILNMSIKQKIASCEVPKCITSGCTVQIHNHPIKVLNGLVGIAKTVEDEGDEEDDDENTNPGLESNIQWEVHLDKSILSPETNRPEQKWILEDVHLKRLASGGRLAKELQDVVDKHMKLDTGDTISDEKLMIPYTILSWLRTNITNNPHEIPSREIEHFWHSVLSAYAKDDNHRKLYSAVMRLISSTPSTESQSVDDGWENYRCWCRAGPIQMPNGKVFHPLQQLHYLPEILDKPTIFENFLEQQFQSGKSNNLEVPCAIPRYFCILVAVLLNPSITDKQFTLSSEKWFHHQNLSHQLVPKIMNKKYGLHGDTVIDSNGATVLMQSWYCLPLLKALLESDSKPNVNLEDSDGNTILHKMLSYTELVGKSSNTEQLSLLLEKGTQVNMVNSHHETPLWLAVRTGHCELVSLLLQHDASVDGPEFDKDRTRRILYPQERRMDSEKINELSVKLTPLMMAARLGHVDMFRLLLKSGATVEYKNRYSKTALHLAVESRDASSSDIFEMCESLLKHISASESIKSEDVLEVVDHRGKTPIMMAAQRGLFEVVKLFQKAGADIFKTDDMKMNILSLALANVVASDQVARRDKHVIKNYPHCFSRDEDLIMHVLSCFRKSDLSELVNVQTTKKWTPLMFAAARSHDLVALKLIDAGACTKLKSAKGRSALHIAIHNSKAEQEDIIEMCNLLLQSQNRTELIEMNDNQDNSALIFAAARGFEKVIKFLVEEHDVHVSATNKQSRTALMIASEKCHFHAVEALLGYAGLVHERGKLSPKWNAFHFALNNQARASERLSVCRLLLKDAIETGKSFPKLLEIPERMSQESVAAVLASDPEFQSLFAEIAGVNITTANAPKEIPNDSPAFLKMLHNEMFQQPNNNTEEPSTPQPEHAGVLRQEKTIQKHDPIMFANQQHFMFSQIKDTALAQRLAGIISVGSSFVEYNDYSSSFVQFEQYDRTNSSQSSNMKTTFGDPSLIRQVKVKCAWQDIEEVAPKSIRPIFTRCEVDWKSFFPGRGTDRKHADDKGCYYLGSDQMKKWSDFLSDIQTTNDKDSPSFTEQNIKDLNTQLMGLDFAGNNQVGFRTLVERSEVSQCFKCETITPGARRSWSTNHGLSDYGIHIPDLFGIVLISLHVFLILATMMYILWRRRITRLRSELTKESQICLPHKRRLARVSLRKFSFLFGLLSYAWLCLVLVSMVASIFYAPLAEHANGHRTSFMILIATMMIETLLASCCVRSTRIGTDGRRVLTLGIVAAEGFADATIVLLKEQRSGPSRQDDVSTRDCTPVSGSISLGSTKDETPKSQLESHKSTLSDTFDKPDNLESDESTSNPTREPCEQTQLVQDNDSTNQDLTVSENLPSAVRVEPSPELIHEGDVFAGPDREAAVQSTVEVDEPDSAEYPRSRHGHIWPAEQLSISCVAPTVQLCRSTQKAIRKRSNSQSVVFSNSTMALRKRSKSVPALLPLGGDSSSSGEEERMQKPMLITQPDDVIDIIPSEISHVSGQDNSDATSQDPMVSGKIYNLSSIAAVAPTKPTVAQLLHVACCAEEQFGNRTRVTMSAKSRIWSTNVGPNPSNSIADTEPTIVSSSAAPCTTESYLPVNSIADCDDIHVSWYFFTLDGVRFFWCEESNSFLAAYFYKDAICNSFHRWNAKGLREHDVNVRRLLAGINHESIDSVENNDRISHRQFKHNLYPTLTAQVDWCLREVFFRSPVQFLLVCYTLLIPCWSFSWNSGSMLVVSLFHLLALIAFLIIGLWPTFAAVRSRWSFYFNKVLESKQTFVVQVYREGRWTYIKPSNMVPGDVFCVPLKMEIPCDAVLLSGALIVDESTLYGTTSALHSYADVAKKPFWDVQPGFMFQQPCVSHVSNENRLYDGSVVMRIVCDNNVDVDPTLKATAVCTDVGARTRRGQLSEAILKSSLDLANRHSKFLDRCIFVLLCVFVIAVSINSTTYGLGAMLNEVLFVKPALVSSYFVIAFVPLFTIAEKWLLVDMYLLVTWVVLFLCVVLVTRQTSSWRLERTGTGVARSNALSSAGFVDTVVLTQPDLLLHSDHNLRLNMILPIYYGKAHFDPGLTLDHVLTEKKLATKNPSLEVSNRFKVLSEEVVGLNFLGAAAGCSHQYSESTGFIGGTAHMQKAVDKALYEGIGWRMFNSNNGDASDSKSKPSKLCYSSRVAHVEEKPMEVLRFLRSNPHNPTSGCIVRCPRTSKLHVILKGPMDRMMDMALPLSVPSRSNLSETALKLVEAKMYVVAFGFRVLDGWTKRHVLNATREEIEKEITLLGFFIFSHTGEHKPTAPAALQILHRASIHTCLVSSSMNFHGDLALALRAGFLHRPYDDSSHWIVAEPAVQHASDLTSDMASTVDSDIPSHISDASIQSFPEFGSEPEEEQQSLSPSTRDSAPSFISARQILGWHHAALLDTVWEVDEEYANSPPGAARKSLTDNGVDARGSCSVISANGSTKSLCCGRTQDSGVQWRDFHTNRVLSLKEVLFLGSARAQIFMDSEAFRRLHRARDMLQSRGVRRRKPCALDRVLPMLRLVWGANHKVKGDMVHSFKRGGHVVAVCGQGFEDSLALADADVSVADQIDAVNEAWSFIPSFVCGIDDKGNSELPLPCLVNVLRHGTGCLASLRAVIFFGIVMATVQAISTGFINVWSPQYSIRNPSMLSSQMMLLYTVLISLAVVSRVNDASDTLAMCRTRIFNRCVAVWIISQVVLGVATLICLLFVGLPVRSLSTEDLATQRSRGSQLAFPYYYETPEAGLFLIWFLWFLITVGVSAKIMSLEKLHHVLSLEGFISSCCVVGIWLVLLLLIWGGPSGFTCWFGINCDNRTSWKYFGKCLFGPQLHEIETKLDRNFQIPTPANDCQYYNAHSQAESFESDVSFSTFSFFSKECQGPHNCIDNFTRIVSTISLLVMSFLAILVSVVMHVQNDPRRLISKNNMVPGREFSFSR